MRGLALLLGLLWSTAALGQEAVKSNATATITKPSIRSEPATPTGFGIVPLPVFGTSPETQLILGALAILHYQPENLELRQQILRTELIFSTTGMVNINARTEAYFFNDRLFLGAGVARKYFPDFFYGVGANTSENAQESYVANGWELDVQPLFSPVKNLFLGPAFIANIVKNEKIEPGGLLDDGSYIGASGGRDIGLGYAARYDTRDNPTNPTSGERVLLSVYGHGNSVGSDFSYTQIEVLVAKYLQTYNDQVLALQFFGNVRVGEAPFFSLAQLGGWKHLRGHYKGRYRDQIEFDLQAEYRVPVVWRLGVVFFAGVGDVAPQFSKFFEYGIKYSFGLGLRFMLDRAAQVNLSADYGYAGTGAGAFYIDAGEAL
jgi:outer membrane protein assembly factor BamA